MYRDNFYLVVDTCSTCRLPKDGDVLWVTSKGANVPVHPGNGSVLVPQTVVSCHMTMKANFTHCLVNCQWCYYLKCSNLKGSHQVN